MIKEKEMQEFLPRAQMKNARGLTLAAIQHEIAVCAREHGVSVAFGNGKIQSGGLLGRGEDCLVLYHPRHQKDYFSIAIQVKHQGDYAFVYVHSFGVSKLMKGEMVRKSVLDTAKEGWNSVGSKDYNVLNSAAAGASMIGAGIIGVRHLIKGNSDKQELEEEQQWYSIVADLIQEAIS